MNPGDKIGRYLLEQELGQGAMACVFVARHPQLEPRVALKILRREVSNDRQYADRFLEDARAAASLNHPNIVGVKDFDTDNGVPFIVMELVDGWSLDRWLKEKGKLEVRDAARVARDIALALSAAHASKIVHRDVKPSNVLMDNKTGAAKLTDFGAAKRDRPDDQALTAHGQPIGTPRYMAPEQVHGEPVDPRTDLWALGATLFEMLAGQPAFSAPSLPRLYQAIVAEEPPKLVSLRPDVPPELASLVGRLLSKSRVARPSTADEVAEALLPFTKPPVAAAPAPTPSAQPAPGAAARSAGLGRPALVGGGLAAVAVLAALALFLWPAPERQESAPAEATAPGPPAPPPVEQAAPEPAPAPTPEPPTQLVEPAPLPPHAPVEQAAPLPAPAPEPPAQVAEPTPAPTPPAPAIDAERIRTVLADIPCVAAEGLVGDGGVVSLTGTAANAELAAKARGAVQAVAGVTSVTDGLRLEPAVGCAAAAAIEAAAGQAGAGPDVTMNRPDGIYREGDFVVLNVTAPPDGPEYLYVDLLTDAGAAIHLLPEPLTPGNRVAAGQTVRLGVEAGERRAGVRDWQVVPPLGPGYLLLVASDRPIYEGVREIEEPLQDYLKVLVPALSNADGGRKAVRVQPIEFRERGD